MKLSKSELTKRDNLVEFVSRFYGGTFRHLEETIIPEYLIIEESKGDIWKWSTALDRVIAEEKLQRVLKKKGAYPKIFIRDTKDRTFNITSIEKDHIFSGKSNPEAIYKVYTERQEHSLVTQINTYTPTLIDGIPYMVYSAEKIEGLSMSGYEPYSDLVLRTEISDLNISCKGLECPSIAGGGISGLSNICPDLLDDLMFSIEKEYRAQEFHHGTEVWYKDVPDMYFDIPQEYSKKILAGTKEMGGPIDYVYQGDMQIDIKGDIPLLFNGEFKSVNSMATEKHFFRTRQRRSKDMYLTFDYSKGKDGYPVFHRSPIGRSFRLVITKFVPQKYISKKIH